MGSGSSPVKLSKLKSNLYNNSLPKLHLPRTLKKLSENALCLWLLLVLPSGAAAESSYEDQVLSTLENIQSAEIDVSVKLLNQLIQQYPNSKLSHLMLADLLSVRAGAGNQAQNFKIDNLQLSGLQDELRYRWQNKMLQSPAHAGYLPVNLIQTSDSQAYIFIVDASASRLYVYENQLGNLTLVDDFYITVGKAGMGKNYEGDLRTPMGVYHVTSYIEGETLPDRYGPGAFPINYPNDIDKRHKRTGYGIWIHGTESENYNRIPLASDGCVSLSNDALVKVSRYIKTDGTTPIIISDSFSWNDQKQIELKRSKFNNLLNQWKVDWENRDHDRYISHYSDTDFRSGQYNYKSWSNHKKSVNNSKTHIKVSIENLSIFSYPGEENLVMMRFDQNYQSNNYSSQSQKTLYWQLDGSKKWKIIFEG